MVSGENGRHGNHVANHAAKAYRNDTGGVTVRMLRMAAVVAMARTQIAGHVGRLNARVCVAIANSNRD